MQEIGRVVEIDENLAIVEVRRKSACEGCHKGAEGCDACSLFIADAKHKISVENHIGAAVGDRVVLEGSSQRVLFYAFLAFILPLLMAAVFFFVASKAFGLGEIQSIAVSVLGMLLSYVVIGEVTAQIERKKRTVHIVRIIQNLENQTESEEC